jgi:hypothetical protein
MITGKTMTVAIRRNIKITAGTTPYLKNLFIRKLRKHHIAGTTTDIVVIR